MYYQNNVPLKDYSLLNKDRELNRYFSADNVGKCVELFDEFFFDTTHDFTREGWEEFYFSKMDIRKLRNIAVVINQKHSIDYETAKQYVFYRVIGQTWNGMMEEMNVIKDIQTEFPNLDFKKTPYKIDNEYFTDWEGYSAELLTIGFQIKPFTYNLMSSPYQLRAKENHEAQRQKYMDEFKVPHMILYYKDHVLQDQERVFNTINTILAYNINVNL